MPVDRGGLDYPVRAIDDFSAVFTDFRNQVAANAAEWAAFRAATAQGGISTAKVNQSANALRAQAASISAVTQQLQAQTQAVAGLTAANRNVPVSSIKIDNSVRTYLRQAPRQFREATVEANKFNSSIGRITRALVLFAAVRQVGAVLSSFVSDLVKFNSEIENVQLGIASVVTAVGTVRNAAGAAVSATQALALGQKEAAKQTRLLRQDALSTTASFEDLAQAFQTAIAPGLNAGLNLNQIRGFAVQISQAAQAIGLSQNQLAEEIRSILAGTIQSRTTRIATALGITNEDIKRAKEAGTLSDFLNKRFAAFSEAGKEAQTTFSGLVNRLKTGFTLVVSSGGLEYFQKVKDLIAGLFNIVATKNPLTGIVEPNPAAILFVQEISKGLSAAVDEVNRLRSSLTADEVVGFASTIGQGIKLFIQFLGAAIEGLVRSATILRPLIQGIVQTLNNNPGLLQLVSGFVTLLVLSKAVNVILGQVFSSLSLASGVIRILNVALATRTLSVLTRASDSANLLRDTFKTIPLLLSRMLSPAGVLLLLTVGVAVASKSWLDNLTGIDLKWTTIYGTVKKATEQAAGFALAQSEVFAGIAASIGKAVFSPTGSKENTKALDEIVAKTKLAKELFLQFQQEVSNGVFDNLSKNDQNPDLTTKLFESLKPIQDKLNGLFGKPLEDTTSLSKALDELPPIISRSGDALSQNGKLVESLIEKAERLKSALSATKGSLGLSGAVLEEFKASVDAAEELRASLKNLSAEQIAAQGLLFDTQKKRIANQLKVNNLSVAEQGVVVETSDLFRSILQRQQAISEATTQLVLAQQDFVAAQKAGDTEGIASGKTKIEALKAQIESLGLLNQQQSESIDKQAESLDPKRASLIKQLILDRVQLEGQEKGILGDINSLAKGRAEIEGLAARAVALAQAATAEQKIFELRRESSKLTLEAEQAQAEFNLRNASDETKALSASSFRLALLRLTVEQADSLRKIELSTLDSLIQQNEAKRASLASSLGTGDAETELATKKQIEALDASILALESQKTLTIQRNTEERRKEVFELKAASAEAERQRLISEAPVGTGFVEGFLEAQKAVEFSFQNSLNFMRGLVESFSAFVSSSIVDAFDPSNDTSLQERFASFLRALAAQIIQTLVTLALTAIALNAASDGLLGPILQAYANSSGARGKGFFRGGRVGGPFEHAEGRAMGGRPSGRRVHGVARPRGLDRRDTVPIWADPREWVIRGDAVQKYGHDFMAKLNEGVLDPMGAKALAGVSGTYARTSRAQGIGMALGGAVADAASAAASARQAAVLSSGSQSGGGSGPVAAYILPTADGHAAMLEAGTNEQLRWMQNNRRDVKGALGIL